MATLIKEVSLLGVFEDAAQRDFHRGMIKRLAENMNIKPQLKSFLTDGCRFDYLADHLQLATHFSGSIVGVDGKKHNSKQKISLLKEGVKKYGLDPLPQPILWSIAFPSIEEWMMADHSAVPSTLAALFGEDHCRDVNRPGRASAERTAKARLAEWTYQILGSPLERRGLEYAEEIGYRTLPDQVGKTRNPELKKLLTNSLPKFLRSCS